MVEKAGLSSLTFTLPAAYTKKLYITYIVNYTSKHYRVYYSLNGRHVIMTCLTWRTLQSKVFVLHFILHFNMPRSRRRKTTNESWSNIFNKKAKKWRRRETYLLIVIQWPGWHMDAAGLSSNNNDRWTPTSKPTVLWLPCIMLKCWLWWQNLIFFLICLNTCRRNYIAWQLLHSLHNYFILKRLDCN